MHYLLKSLLAVLVVMCLYWLYQKGLNKSTTDTISSPLKMKDIEYIDKQNNISENTSTPYYLKIKSADKLDEETEKLISEMTDQYANQSNETPRVSEAKVNEVLSYIPDNYHVMFKDDEYTFDSRIKDYADFITAQPEADSNYDLEKQLTGFIYQHNIGNDIELNRVDCSSKQCEILGIQKGSGSWVIIEGELSQQPWLSLKNITSFQGYNNQGEMVFITLLR